MNLSELGWGSFFELHFEQFRTQGLVPARVAREHGRTYLLYGEQGEMGAELSGKVRHRASSKTELPVVGDWVVIQARPEERRATIRGVLPRKTRFSRKVAGAGTEEQVVAANVNTAFLVSGLDQEFNLRRIERYVTLAWDSGADPVVVLNKADLCIDVDACVSQVQSVAIGVPVHPVSAVESQGLDLLRKYLGVGKTASLLGSSGVGKSTLINSLIGEERQTVKAVRRTDGRGRHTTSSRELILLPGDGMIIDNPGMREIQLWADEEGLKEAFEDIEELAVGCRFRDCKHASEPGCAVRRALEEGTLDSKRFKSYLKLRRELRYLARRKYESAILAERAKWKKISQWSKKIKKHKKSLL